MDAQVCFKRGWIEPLSKKIKYISADGLFGNSLTYGQTKSKVIKLYQKRPEKIHGPWMSPISMGEYICSFLDWFT